MNKKFLSLLLALVLIFCSSSSVLAADARATNYVDVKTSGGTSGYITIRFRCTCVQETISTQYSFAASMTPPTGISGLTYSHNGAVTLSDHSQDPFTSTKASFSKVYNDAILGGYSSMTAKSTAFGSA